MRRFTALLVGLAFLVAFLPQPGIAGRVPARAGMLAAGGMLSTSSLGALPHAAPGWSGVLDISETTWGSYNPELTFDPEGYSHVVWYGDGETNSDWSIWYTNNRGGGTWASKHLITTGYDLRAPYIVTGPAGRLYVLYEDRGINQIMYVESTDRGATWSTKVNVSKSSGNGYEGAIAVDSQGNVYAVWTDSRWAGSQYYSVTYSKRPAGGAWTAPVRVQTAVGFNKEPRIDVTESGSNVTVHVVFYGKGASSDPNSSAELYYLRGDGTTWEAPRNLSQSPSYASYTPDIMAYGAGNLYIGWDENPSPASYHDIFMIHSADNGTSWSAPIYITYDSSLGRSPAIAYAMGKVQIAYDSDIAGSGDTFYTNYDPAAGTLAPAVNLAQTGGESKEVDIDGNLCRVAVAWMDKGTQWDILYTTTPDTLPEPCEMICLPLLSKGF